MTPTKEEFTQKILELQRINNINRNREYYAYTRSLRDNKHKYRNKYCGFFRRW